MDFFNLPWMGIRASSLPAMLLSSPDGRYHAVGGVFGTGKDKYGVDFKQTGGWAAFINEKTNQTLTIVFGKDKHLGKVSYQYAPSSWQWGATTSPPNLRDSNIGTTNQFIKLPPGGAYYYRYYLIIGKIGKTSLYASQLVDKVDYGMLDFNENNSPLIPYYLVANELGQSILTNEAQGQPPLLYTYAMPVKNSVPLFLVQSTVTQLYKLTFDPNLLSTQFPFKNPYKPADPQYALYQNRITYKPYDGNTNYVGFLGYVMPAQFADDKLGYGFLKVMVKDNTYYPAGTNAQFQAGYASLKARICP